MREKADQANNQREDLTSMDNARSRTVLFQDGVGSGRYLHFGKPSIAKMARFLGTSDKMLQKQIYSASLEQELRPIYGTDGGVLTENVHHYTATAGLSDDPVNRVELIRTAIKNDIGDRPLLSITQSMKKAPESRDIILNQVDAGTDYRALRDAVGATIDLDPSIRRPLIALRSSEHIRKDELPRMAEVLKETPELAPSS
jgi:hypothetical protein